MRSYVEARGPLTIEAAGERGTNITCAAARLCFLLQLPVALLCFNVALFCLLVALLGLLQVELKGCCVFTVIISLLVLRAN